MLVKRFGEQCQHLIAAQAFVAGQDIEFHQKEVFLRVGASLQDPESLGFPSWVPSALTTVQASAPLDIKPWTILEVCFPITASSR